MKVAALYDVHGNMPALEAVLAEAEPEADVIVVGGDSVGGDSPGRALERLRGLGDRVRWVRGNLERELLEPRPSRPGGPPPGTLEELRSKLSDEQVSLLFRLPERLSLEIHGLGRVLFCHATPRSDEEIVTSLSSQARLREVLSGVEEDVVVVGHTHMQDDRRLEALRFVNAGSVGMPYEAEPGAYWVLLGPGVDFRRTEYPEAEAPLASRSEAAEYFESLVS